MLTIVIFFVFLFFFDKNNLLTQYAYQTQLNTLKSEKAYFNEEIKKTRNELEELTTNPVSLEKFAREQYYMKKDSEEVFVFTTLN